MVHTLWNDIGITRLGALAVATSAAVMYAVFAFVLHQWGARLRSTTSASMALAALVGAISARAILGNHPTLGGGLVALATLLVMERLFGGLRRVGRRGLPRRRQRAAMESR